MRLAITNTGDMAHLIDHCNDAVTQLDADCEAVVVGNVTQWMDVELPLVNTCQGLMILMLKPELKRAYEKQFELGKGEIVSSIYSVFNGQEFAPFIEVDYTDRMLTNDIGRRIAFTQGTAMPVPQAYQAVMQLSELRDFLRELNYHGEVAISLNRDYCIHSIGYGHFYGHFALYNEMINLSPQRLLEWIIGNEDSVELREGCAVGTLVSLCPFPEIMLQLTHKIKVPSGAQKHAWRIVYGNQEAYLITSFGITINEAKRRTRRSIKNCERLHDELQYRTDYGYKNKFLISQESYEELNQSPKLS